MNRIDQLNYKPFLIVKSRFSKVYNVKMCALRA